MRAQPGRDKDPPELHGSQTSHRLRTRIGQQTSGNPDGRWFPAYQDKGLLYAQRNRAGGRVFLSQIDLPVPVLLECH